MHSHRGLPCILHKIQEFSGDPQSFDGNHRLVLLPVQRFRRPNTARISNVSQSQVGSTASILCWPVQHFFENNIVVRTGPGLAVHHNSPSSER